MIAREIILAVCKARRASSHPDVAKVCDLLQATLTDGIPDAT